MVLPNLLSIVSLLEKHCAFNIWFGFTLQAHIYEISFERTSKNHDLSLYIYIIVVWVTFLPIRDLIILHHNLYCIKAQIINIIVLKFGLLDDGKHVLKLKNMVPMKVSKYTHLKLALILYWSVLRFPLLILNNI